MVVSRAPKVVGGQPGPEGWPSRLAQDRWRGTEGVPRRVGEESKCKGRKRKNKNCLKR